MQFNQFHLFNAPSIEVKVSLGRPLNSHHAAFITPIRFPLEYAEAVVRGGIYISFRRHTSARLLSRMCTHVFRGRLGFVFICVFYLPVQHGSPDSSNTPDGQQ